MARPSKFTPDRRDRFLAALAAGVLPETAARYAGWSPATLYRILAGPRPTHIAFWTTSAASRPSSNCAWRVRSPRRRSQIRGSPSRCSNAASASDGVAGPRCSACGLGGSRPATTSTSHGRRHPRPRPVEAMPHASSRPGRPRRLTRGAERVTASRTTARHEERSRERLPGRPLRAAGRPEPIGARCALAASFPTVPGRGPRRRWPPAEPRPHICSPGPASSPPSRAWSCSPLGPMARRRCPRLRRLALLVPRP